MRQKTQTIRSALAALCVTVLLSAAASETNAQRFDLSGRHVAIYNLAGQVNVLPVRGSAVVVDVNVGGRDGDELFIETGDIGDAETLRVIYPADRVTYAAGRGSFRTNLRVRSDGTFSDSDWRGRRSRGDEVRITSRRGGLEAYADLTISVPNGQRISVYLAVGEATVENVNGDIRIDTHSAPVYAAGTRGSLLVDVGSGAVEVRDALGDVDVDTGSGSVDASNISGDILHIDTGSGRVTASGVDVEDLHIDTGSGAIDAARVSASSVLLDTGSGSVDLELTSDADDIEIDTGSGGVRVTVPSSFGAQVNIDTGSGGIELDMPITMRRWQRDHVQGVIGDGEGRLHIDTGSGSIRILSGR